MFITMKFMPKQYVSALESISLVSKVLGWGSNIVHLLLDWELIWTFTLCMDLSQDWSLEIMFACSLCPLIIEDGDLPLYPARILVFTAKIIYCSFCNWPCTVFISFAFAVVISLIATELVSPPYQLVHDILYRTISPIIMILSASDNLCHSSLLKSYDGWTSNCDL